MGLDTCNNRPELSEPLILDWGLGSRVKVEGLGFNPNLSPTLIPTFAANQLGVKP